MCVWKNRLPSIVKIVEFVRETPAQSKVEKQARQDRLTDLVFALIIFGVSYWLKFFIISFYIQTVGNNSGFEFKNSYPEFFWLTRLFGWEPDQVIQTEGYVDFSWYYLPYVDNFAYGWNPYEGETTAIYYPERMGGYVYGPFYILWISIGKIFFGLDAWQSVLVSNVIFDSLTSVLVYILAKRYTGNGIAFLLGMMHSVVPISLFYANIYGLNTPQMTFFGVLYLWFYLEHHDSMGFVILSLGFLTKQFPLLFAMPALMLMVRRYGWLRGFTFLMEFIIWSLLFSLPYIVVSPRSYVIKLFLASRAPSSVPSLEYLLSNGGIAPNLVSSIVANEDYEFASKMAKLVNTQLLFVLTLFFVSYTAFSAYRFIEEKPYLIFRFAAMFFFLAHGTIPRGIYKYYTPFLMPFLILALAPHRPNTLHFRFGHALKKGWSTFFDPTFRLKEPSFKYWSMFLTLIVSQLFIFAVISWSVSLFADTPQDKNLFNFLLMSISVFLVIWPSPKNEDTLPKPIPKTDNEIQNNGIKDEANEKELVLVTVFAIISTIAIFLYFFGLLSNGDAVSALFNNVGLLPFSFILFLQALKWDQTFQSSSEDEKVQSRIQNFQIGIMLLYLLILIFSLNGNFPIFRNDPVIEFIGLKIKGNVLIITLSSFMLSYFLASLSLQIVMLNWSEKLNLPTITKIDIQPRNFVLTVPLLILFFLIQQVTPLFFKSHTTKEFFFLTAAALAVCTFLYLDFSINWVRDEEKNIVYSMDPVHWILDLAKIVALISIVFVVNKMILTVPRLQNPALILLIGMALMPYMGAEFWESLIRFNVNAIKKIQSRLTERT